MLKCLILNGTWFLGISRGGEDRFATQVSELALKSEDAGPNIPGDGCCNEKRCSGPLLGCRLRRSALGTVSPTPDSGSQQPCCCRFSASLITA